MNEKILKILFSGISEKIEEEIKKNLDGTECLAEFCDLKDTENFISNFHPDILLTTIQSSFNDYQKRVLSLKEISLSLDIPFAVMVNQSNNEPYVFLLNNGITGIITSPVNSRDFLNYIKEYLCIANSSAEPAGNFCSNSENSLISNLVIQNRMLKDNLKKNRSASDIETDKAAEHYNDIHTTRINEHRVIENKLWEAYENGYFRLFYQPVISIASGKLAGFEALIRIIHPVDGLITPDVFIPVAESSAIIFPLGLWIIEEACRQIQLWKDMFVLDTPLRINVNLSAKQFIHPDLTKHIFEITEKYGIGENDIAFELTESAFMEDMESANIALLELRSKKFALYMDDFGTGYSSLSYLMHFPVNVIKIDQSFVKWMHIDEQSETLVRSLVALAHNLDLKVVAEGTDDESHIEILKSCGCDYAQGYYFARPLPAEAAGKFISDHFEAK